MTHIDLMAWATAEVRKLDRNAPRRPLAEFMAERGKPRKTRKIRLIVQVVLRLPEMVRTMRSAR